MMKCLYGTILVLSIIQACAAAPKPAIVQQPFQWTAQVTYEPLRQIIYQPTPDTPARRFWYIILTITNKTDHDIEFLPQCDMMTDTFRIIAAGTQVPEDLFPLIKIRYQNKFPLLEPLTPTGTRILQGEDYARDFALIWPDVDPEVRDVTLFITGLSNETAVVEPPLLRDDAGNPIKVFLRKTLQLDYTLRSDVAFRTNEDVKFNGQEWIMR